MNFKRFGRTANLFDGIIESGYYNDNGILVADQTTSHSTSYIPVTTTTYTISGLWYQAGLMANFAVYEWDSNKNWLRRSNRQYPPETNVITFTIGSDTAYITLQIQTSHGDVMLNVGSTALPYQPYMDWNNIPHYIHNTATDTITTPADIYANDTTATVGLKGNMAQTGTPMPSSPIQPSECGDRTGNLFDLSSAQEGYGIDASGNVVSRAGRITTTPIDVSDLSMVFITWVASSDSIRYIYATFSNGVLVERVANKYANTTIDVSSADQLYICLYAGTDISKSDFTSIMLNTGSTPLPYEPWGIKIPILSNSQTTNVYLGEVQSTRRIKKLVLDGTEDWTYSASGGKKRVFVTGFDRAQIATSLCSHFVNMDYVSYPDSGKFAINAASTIQTMIFGVTDMAITSATDWTTYLATQYAAGTPVIIWYVLAEPTTGIVNEPLRKIGNYADEVSGITIPVTAGANTISVDTTLQPSEVNATYKGWHPVQSVHERTNGAWT